MFKLPLKSTGNACLSGILFFLIFMASQALAQSGKYDLRLVQESVDCATRKVTFSAQIRASDPGSKFILGSSSILFTNQTPQILSNPVLTSADHYSGGRYSLLTLSDQDNVLTLSIEYSGTAPFNDTLNVVSAWTSIAHITFDIASPSDGCYVLDWNGVDDFPNTDVLQVVLNNGTKNEVGAVPGAFTNITGCAFAGLLPVATITGDTTIQAGQQANLKVNFTGSTPVSLTINGVAYNNITQSPLFIPVSPATTTTYTLGPVSNACGAGTGSGSATVTVQPATITTQNLASATVCAGSVVPVSFTATGGPAAGNTYRVQLSDAAGANFADIPTTGNSSPLTATIPASTPPGTGYRVRVVGSAPAVVGSPSAAFAVPAPPTAALSGGGTIPPGGTANLSVQLTGTAPWRVTLSNGVEYTGQASPLTVSVSPPATTTYTVTSVADACGAGTGSGSATVTVSEPATITTQNLASATFCAGSAVPVSFTATGGPAAGNTYRVQLSDAAGANFADIPTTGNSSPLTATIPASTPPGTGYRVRVVGSAPAVVGSPSAAFAVPAPPTAALSGGGTIPPGGTANLSVQLTGTAPWRVTLSNGVEYTGQASPLTVSVSPPATTTYTVTSVADACGAGTGSGSATVTVSEPATITTQNLASATFCAGSAVPVSFTATGGPAAGNTYRVQLSDAAGANFADIPTTGNSSPLTATIPASTPPGTGYRVRVVGSAPAVVGSPSAAFAVPAPPTAALSGGGTIPPGGTANLSVQLTGTAPWRVTLSNGVEYTGQASPLTVSVSPPATTTYTVTSVADACGAGTGSGSATVTVSEPATITTQNLASATFCAGSVVPVSFTATGGPAAGNTYRVQLSDAAGANFADIPTTGNSSPLTATIPASTPPGTGYRVRVVGSAPAVVGSPSAAFAVPAPPTAALSGGGTIPPGGTANLSVQLTGTAPWRVTLSNGVEYTGQASPLTVSVSPPATTTYTVTSVADACGAGTGSGSATVTVQPEPESCKALCVPVTFEIVKR